MTDWILYILWAIAIAVVPFFIGTGNWWWMATGAICASIATFMFLLDEL